MSLTIYTKNCERCAQPFSRGVAEGYSKSRFAKMRFCGRACSYHSRDTKPARPSRGQSTKCAVCSKEFYLFPREMKLGRRLCSVKCYKLFQRTNRPLNCINCGGEFYVSRSQEASRNRKCCSVKCRAKVYARSGSDCPFWRGGVSDQNRLIRYSARMKDWRKAVFKRDDYRCQQCGARSAKGNPVTLHAHHIKQFAYYPELRFEISNGLTLCDGCHQHTGHERRAS